MGIPRFYRLITEQFPTVSKHTSFKNGFSHAGNIDNLYLDANGILHNCAREVYFDKQQTKKRLARKHDTCPVQKEYELFCAISTYIDQLFKFVKPKKLFYIAIDGPAPLAKQSQQRQRRYKAANAKTAEELKIFDSTAITPGTAFMYRLSNYLRFYINKMLSTDRDWKKVIIVFSGPDVPGEGEHKIVHYIREQKNAVDLVHCMYGLDADLFMLSLGTHCPHFYLLREDQFNTVWNDTLFYEVDIGLLRTKIFQYWGSLGGNEIGLINDFIFVCFLAGNDFLHALPCCHNLSLSINFIMDLRKQVLGSSYITNSAGFSLNNLTILLTALQTTEESTIAEQFYCQNFPNLTLNNSLKDPKHPEQGIDLKHYRELYYRKAGIDAFNRNEVWSFCKHYIQGLEWVQYYYHAKPKNWQWYYPFHYSPVIIDLLDYLTNATRGFKLTRVSNKCLGPILPFQQLLCVVPPQSKNLLPKYLRYLYEEESLQKYYPKKYSLDFEGKIREWEAIALLPFIQLNRVIDACEKAEKRAIQKNFKTTFVRNSFGDTVMYWYTPNNKHIYNSKYGQIKNCSVSYRTLN